jgi:uncharacterized protein
MNGALTGAMRRLLSVLLLLALAGVLLALWGYRNALADPVRREARVALPGLRTPLRVVFLTDIHVTGPDVPPARVSRLVADVNAARPDLVLIAGDFVGDHRLATRAYPPSAIATPFAALRPRLGTVAVLGNHDHGHNAPAIRRALEAAGVRVLVNRAVRAGPVTIAGADDAFTGRDDMPALEKATAALGGPAILLSHSPDVVPKLSRGFPLVLAGHTHCGQVSLPLLGPPVTFTRTGKRYACGIDRDPARTVITGAGLGTSMLPIRLGAPPDWWLVTLGPA